MSRPNTLFLALIFSAIALLPFRSSADTASADFLSKPAFLERIPPADFISVEDLGPKRFSATSQLVILRTERDQIKYVLTLRQDPTAGYVWDAYYLTGKSERLEPTISIEFDPKVARQYLGALNYRLSRWVTVVEKSHKPGFYEEAWWIYYPVQGGAVAGLFDSADLARNPNAKAFADLFFHGPERLLASDATTQNEILADIDQKCSSIVRDESAK